MRLEELAVWTEQMMPALYGTPIELNFFATEEGEKIMFRNDPSEAVEERYMDGSRVGSFVFSVFARSASQDTAASAINQIVDLFDLPEYQIITEGCQVKIEPLTSVQPVQKTDLNEYIFTASLGLEYFKEA